MKWLTLLSVFIVGISSEGNASTTDALIDSLDRAIDMRQSYSARRQSTIDLTRRRLERATDDSTRFEALCRLHDLYLTFNTDSALHYSQLSVKAARGSGVDSLVNRGLLNVADVFATAGMYSEALAIVDSIKPASVTSTDLRLFYYHVHRTLNGLLADFAIDPALRRKYATATDAYRDSLIAVLPQSSATADVIRAERLTARGYPDSAVALLSTTLAGLATDDYRQRAITAYTLSKAYETDGDTENRKRALAASAAADMKSGVREYLSLLELAQLLYNDGDIDRAYRYLTTTLDDATRCNARLRIIQSGDLFPVVSQMYNAKISGESRRVRFAALAVVILAIALIAVVWRLWRQMRKVSHARARLRDLNDELQAANSRLSQANQAIAENSRLKTEYIARYMDQCSAYIERLDSQRKGIARLLSLGKIDEANRQVNSSAMVNAQLEEFYKGFDEAFLNLFPTFVTDFNALLRPDERITPKAEGQLTTELRIFALIRLGISDSAKISRFLRYSVTTIYNYRTRMRNRALADRDLLEAKVMRIGRIDQQ